MNTHDPRTDGRRAAARIALIYVTAAGLWILLSDRLLGMLVKDPAILTRLQTGKGWFFVAVTGAGLYWLIERHAGLLRRRDLALQEIVKGVSPETGEAFCHSLVRHLAAAVGADYALVGELAGNGGAVRTVAVHAPAPTDNFEYALAGTPCEKVMEGGLCSYVSGVQRLFPEDHLLQEMDVESYSGMPLRDTAGRPIGLLVVMAKQPVPREPAASLLRIFAARAAAELERRRTEAALAAQFEQISAIFDSINTLVYVADLETNELLFMNRFGTSLFGDKWRGRRCFEVLQTNQADTCAFCTNPEIVRDGVPTGPVTWEFQNTRTRQWFQCIDQAIRWPDGRLVRLEVAVDITERKELERVKDEMLSAVSHEMRTPLTAILGYSDFLLENEVPLEQLRPMLEVLDKEAHRLNGLIGNFLTVQRLRARRPHYSLQPVELRELVERTIATFRFASHHHRFEVDLPANLPAVLGDAEALQEVLDNLVSNAIKYSPGGGRVGISAVAGEGEVVLSVADEGVGIATGELERIFQRFYRIDNNDRRPAGGTGLGLALVQEIVQNHGGSVRVESEPGRGSTFHVTLPTAPEEQR